jgi:tellurite methyltransferase
LLEKGFRVTAVDAEQEAIDHLKQMLPPSAQVATIVSTFQDLTWSRADSPNALGTFNVVIAQFALFFMSPPEFATFWTKLLNAIRPGGLLSMQLLGENDEWKDRGYTLHTPEQVEDILEPFEVLFLDEVERDGETAVGTPKHWHVFHIVARKL